MSNDGGQAFPGSSLHSDARNPGWIGGGMSLRDYFAAKALVGIMCNEAEHTHAIEEADGYSNDPHYPWWFLARLSFEIADAMLAERAKAVRP